MPPAQPFWGDLQGNKCLPGDLVGNSLLGLGGRDWNMNYHPHLARICRMSPFGTHREDLWGLFSRTRLQACHCVTLSTGSIPQGPPSASPGPAWCLLSSCILPTAALRPQMMRKSSLYRVVVGNACSAHLCFPFGTPFPAPSERDCGHFPHLLSRLPPSCRRTSSLLQVTWSAPLFSVIPFLTSVLSSGSENLMVSQTPTAESHGESVKNQNPDSTQDLLNQNLWFWLPEIKFSR